ncbi:hypothetical protein DFH09DRAFT_1118053 [Mycena vulgaris]|nr:hypothetical protein DFH09DRAFT_1118053 [Mycena vulgaris]
MKISFSILFAIFLSIETFAAPVPTADVGNGLSLEVRKAKAVKKGPVRALSVKILCIGAAIPKDFQQYAVVNQAVADKNLKLQKRHKAILCANVPKGNKLSARVYAQGQRTNVEFAKRLQTLQAAPGIITALRPPVDTDRGGLHQIDAPFAAICKRSGRVGKSPDDTSGPADSVASAALVGGRVAVPCATGAGKIARRLST